MWEAPVDYIGIFVIDNIAGWEQAGRTIQVLAFHKLVSHQCCVICLSLGFLFTLLPSVAFLLVLWGVPLYFVALSGVSFGSQAPFGILISSLRDYSLLSGLLLGSFWLSRPLWDPSLSSEASFSGFWSFVGYHLALEPSILFFLVLHHLSGPSPLYSLPLVPCMLCGSLWGTSWLRGESVLFYTHYVVFTKCNCKVSSWM